MKLTKGREKGRDRQILTDLPSEYVVELSVSGH